MSVERGGARTGIDIRGTGAPAHITAVAALLIVFLVHLTGQIFARFSFITEASQVLLMPALAAILLSATVKPRMRIVKLGFVALFFSWVGDTLPRFMSGDAGFLAMIGGFLVAQCVYIIAFAPYRRRSILTKPLCAAPYMAAVVVLLALCFEGAGTLFVPVALYAVVIVAMAILATGLSTTGAIGGIVFLVSDSLIALDAFAGLALPGQGFWVMLTYVIGQTLLIQAIIGHEERNTVTRTPRGNGWTASPREQRPTNGNGQEMPAPKRMPEMPVPDRMPPA